MDIGFKMVVWELEQDAEHDKLPRPDIDILKAWGRSGGFSFSPSNPIGKCSTQAGQFMSAWKGTLQAWLKAHPGQPPPSGITTPPSTPACGI